MVVTKRIDARQKNGELICNVHFRPILSANGPAANGATKYRIIFNKQFLNNDFNLNGLLWGFCSLL